MRFLKSDFRVRKYKDKVTWNDGEDFEEFEWESMVDIIFELSQHETINKWKHHGIIQVLSQFGGLVSTLLLVFRPLATKINNRLLLSRTIEDLYYVNKDIISDKQDENPSHIKDESSQTYIDFKLSEKCWCITKPFRCLTKGKHKLSKS